MRTCDICGLKDVSGVIDEYDFSSAVHSDFQCDDIDDQMEKDFCDGCKNAYEAILTDRLGAAVRFDAIKEEVLESLAIAKAEKDEEAARQKKLQEEAARVKATLGGG